MFDKILIANRGEIACRVIRTARRLGIATVAVHSDADSTARHVRLAGEAVRIGPAAARESYLRGDLVIDAAKRSGAQAIHPGYGFLSENADFAEACAQAGLVFIGPPASAIRAMGSKSAAKALMQKAGVPLTPGYHGDVQDAAFLANEAGRIGYPVLIKASAGGGGKGMRRVDRAEDFEPSLASCRREAQGAFGDDHVLVEKYVLEPRHIEIQVFGDVQGHVVHLFERDCSVQRRHQKVLEEAPAPGMTAERRAAMGRAAVDAAMAVGYVGAGTVEFIAQQDGSFYFMEMNTRLQVEHPVTEMITGLDLVEWQLRVAAGEPLPLTQSQLAITGHAIEARIYAEDADRGFLPSIGRLVHLRLPTPSAHVRIDSGVKQGDEITPHYDPMIAKLIVHGSDRADALARLRAALAQYRIAGVRNNVDFLSRLVATRSFIEPRLDTALIEREAAVLFAPRDVPDDAWIAATLFELHSEDAATRAMAARSIDPGSPWWAVDGWRLSGRAVRRIVWRCADDEHEVVAQGRRVSIDGRSIDAGMTINADGDLRLALGDRQFDASVVAIGELRHVFIGARSWILQRVVATRASDHETEAGGLHAPMPGKVIALLAAIGTRLDKGAPLLVMEAMKMEHTIFAPHAGIVRGFRFAVGEPVAEGVELVDFEAEAK